MPCSESLHHPAWRRLGLPLSLLMMTAIASAASGAEITINDGDSYVNSAAPIDIYGVGNVGTIENRAGAMIGTATGMALDIVGNVGAFINAGTILSDGNAVNIGGAVSSFTNATGGRIESLQFSGVYFSGASAFNNAGAIRGHEWGVVTTGALGTFTNAAGGTIEGTTLDGVNLLDVEQFSNAGRILGAVGGAYINGAVGSFNNAAGGVIEGAAGHGVEINGAVDNFTNAGRLYGAAFGAFVNGDVASISNAAGGNIEGLADGFDIYGSVGRFTNAGNIRGTDWGLYVGGDIDTFTNAASGEIVSRFNALHVTGNVAAITNDGAIRSNDGAPTLLIEGDVGSFINRGTVEGGGWGVGLGSVDSFFNSGTIAALGPGPRIGVLVAPFPGSTGITKNFVNTGTIEGSETAVRLEGGVANMVNAGVLRGGVNALDSVGVFDDTLTLLTGSKIFGALSFGGGYDTLDFSNFTGNTLLLVGGLEKFVPGNANHVDARGGAGGQIAIFDLSGLNSKAIGRDLGDITGAVRALIVDRLFKELASQPPRPAPLNYVAAKPATGAAAALSDFDAAPASDVSVWASATGGASVDKDSLDLHSRFGGLVAGSYALVSDTLTLGGLAGYFDSRTSVLGGEEALESQTGLLGLYGKTMLGGVDLDFALLGGLNNHASARQVIANGRVETATGAFASVFLAPSLGGSIPVLSSDASTLLLRGEASYIAGLTSAYTETGSSMNLAVGAQSIGFLDIWFGLEARHRIEGGDHRSELMAKAGVLAEANLGGSRVPVSTLGQTVDVGTPGSGSYGLYGGFGFDAAVNDNFGFNARLDGVVRADGRAGLNASLGLGGTF